jgi:hypothetical protein
MVRALKALSGGELGNIDRGHGRFARYRVLLFSLGQEQLRFLRASSWLYVSRTPSLNVSLGQEL